MIAELAFKQARKRNHLLSL